MSSSGPLPGEDQPMSEVHGAEAAAQHQQQVAAHQAAQAAAQAAQNQFAQHQAGGPGMSTSVQSFELTPAQQAAIVQAATQQATAAMMQQQQQQAPTQSQSTPICQLPAWDGKLDAGAHLKKLANTLEANNQVYILEQPQRFAAVLYTTCSQVQKATEFLDVWRSEHPIFTTQEVQAAFTERFQSEVRSRSAMSRDALFNRQVRMSVGMSVQDYASLFRQHIVHLPEMHENDRIRWFLQGLTTQLRTQCVVDQNGNDFISLDAMIKFAVGQERRMQIMQQSTPRFPTRLNHAQATDMDELGHISKSQKLHSHGYSEASAAPMTGLRGRGSGFSRGRGRSAAPPIRGGGVRGKGARGASTSGRGGGNSSNSSNSSKKLAALSTLTRFKDRTGRNISLAEYNVWKKEGVCFKCAILGPEGQHMAVDCKNAPKPFPDDPVPPC